LYEKAAHKILVKLTPGGSMGLKCLLKLVLVKNHKIAKSSAATETRKKINTYLDFCSDNQALYWLKILISLCPNQKTKSSKMIRSLHFTLRAFVAVF
jgi:hypothetical protein